MGILDFFGVPADHSFIPDPSKGMVGLLSPSDRLMALFQGLSAAGAKMATPGLSKGQALAAGLGGIGEGMNTGMTTALQTRLVGQKLAKDAKQQLAADRMVTALKSGSLTGGADMLAAGGPKGEGLLQVPKAQAGLLADMIAMDPETGLKLAGSHLLTKPLQGKDRYQWIEGVGLVDYANPGKPGIALPPTSRTEFGKLIEDQQKYKDNPQAFAAFEALKQQAQIKDGYRTNADGTMSAATGGPSDPRVAASLEGAKAGARAPWEVAVANAKPYSLPPATVRMPGSPLSLMPSHMPAAAAPGPGPRASAAPMPSGGPPAPQMPPAPGGSRTVPTGPQPIAQSPYPPTPLVSMDMKGETAEASELGKGRAARFNQLLEQSNVATRTIDEVRLARAIKAPTDRAAGVREFVGGWLDALGANGKMAREAADLQKLNSVASNFVLSKQLEQKGVQTASDADRMEKTFAKATNTLEANDFILRAIEAQAHRTMEQADFYSQYRDGKKSLDGVDTAWRDHIRGTPLILTRADGRTLFFNEFAEFAQKAQPGITREEILAEWKKGATK